MYTLSQLRRRVNALRRKYARELAIVRLRPLAEDFSQEWAATVADRRPAPRPQPLPRRLAQHGFRLPTFIALHQYLERCRSDGKTPDCYNIIAALLSRIPGDQLGQLLQWIPLAPKSPRSGGVGPGVRENQAGQSRLNSENPTVSF